MNICLTWEQINDGWLHIFITDREKLVETRLTLKVGQDLLDCECSQTEDLTRQGRVVGVHLHHLLELPLPPLPHRAQHQQRRRRRGGGGGGEDWS